MKLVMSPQAIAVVRLPVGVPDPEWARGGPLVSVTRTARETSVIVPTSSVPEDVPGPVQGPLVGVYVDEELDFSQVGILVALLKPLADAGIPVLTVSTYDTDWVLVEASKAAAASSVWRAAGYQVVDAARASDDGTTDDHAPDDGTTDDHAPDDDTVVDLRDEARTGGSSPTSSGKDSR
jgi:hypothetical protein